MRSLPEDFRFTAEAVAIGASAGGIDAAGGGADGHHVGGAPEVGGDGVLHACPGSLR